MQEEELTDEGMIARIQHGERQYLELLIRKYYDDIYYFCSYKIGDRQQAYDCTQETFLKLTRYIHTYGERNKFKGYLFSIARNVCMDYFRGKTPEAADSEEILSGTAAKDEFGRTELSQVLNKALQGITTEQREVVVLRFYYDFKVKEIARIVGVPLPTAKSRLKRGMGKLKEILEKEGITYEG